MKSIELHIRIKKARWSFVRQDGTSHIFYEKEGEAICVPFHGSKEVPTGTMYKIMKIAGIK